MRTAVLFIKLVQMLYNYDKNISVDQLNIKIDNQRQLYINSGNMDFTANSSILIFWSKIFAFDTLFAWGL